MTGFGVDFAIVLSLEPMLTVSGVTDGTVTESAIETLLPLPTRVESRAHCSSLGAAAVTTTFVESLKTLSTSTSVSTAYVVPSATPVTSPVLVTLAMGLPVRARGRVTHENVFPGIG